MTFVQFAIENGVVNFAPKVYSLKSGKKSHWYFNWRSVTEDCALTKELAKYIISFVLSQGLDANTFYGVPEGATKIGLITQYEWARNNKVFEKGSHSLIMGRGKQKKHGDIGDRVFLGIPKGNVVVIEDVVTSGASLMKTVDDLLENDVDVKGVITLTDRSNNEIEKKLRGKGIKYFSMSSDSELKQLYCREKICVALDNIDSLEKIKTIVNRLKKYVGMFKIGSGSFTRFGYEVIETVNNSGSKLFLDLKYHDIPNTVKQAAYEAAMHNVYMFNVHASGGFKMMRAAVKGVKNSSCNAKLIGVTALTSHSKQYFEQFEGFEEYVLKLAKSTADAGLDGIVCSANDITAMKNHLPEDFLYITPGIKTKNKVGYDQKRVCTPQEALKSGSSILVIGRAITGYDSIEEMENAAKDIHKSICEIK
ncbi:MAG: Orotate phosphoribosyltransferase [Candidatus Woesearchaeota archaeon]|nr:Orotate phosphoribosyltransferase [Candidatus Woesearchaeota archaeon]